MPAEHIRPDALAVHDVRDARGFVIRALPNVTLSPDAREELIAEGVRILLEMAERYRPGHGGRDPSGSRFSGYAARFLPGKLLDAWRRTEGHSCHHLPDGTRQWRPPPQTIPLSACEEDHVPQRQGAHQDEQIVTRLADAIDALWRQERALTLRVGIALSEGVAVAHLPSLLHIRRAEAQEAVARIERALPHLTSIAA